jgi:hypothetical protein
VEQHRASTRASIAAVVVAATGAGALLIAKTVGPVQHVIDERVFRDAVGRMRGGAGYYPAMQAALTKAGVAASQVRSFRPATLYLALRFVPPSAYRWLGAVVAATSVVLGWRLVRHTNRWVQAVVIVGLAMWVGSLLQAAYLYAELWALPLMLGALLAIRRDDWLLAAVLVALAATVRELYAPALLLGLLVAPPDRRRPWAVALGAIGVLGALHAWLASQQLVTHGHEAPFAAATNLGYTLRFMFSPTHYVVPGLAMTAITALGAVGLARTQAEDPAARFALLVWTVLAVATLYGGRQYWPLLFAPLAVPFLGGPRAPATELAGVDAEERRQEPAGVAA